VDKEIQELKFEPQLAFSNNYARFVVLPPWNLEN